jgi:NADPH-dependent glutamate synthase beta subunit-like oxidoreductase
MRIDEKTCLSEKLNGAISIRSLKRFVADRDTGNWKKFSRQLAPTGKKVAVVGSGPAGLTAGYYLAKLGHTVTIFEALSKSGGMMQVGIPDYRLPKDILDKEIKEIQSVGIDIKLNTKITSVDELFSKGYDAVFVAIGAHRGMKLGVDGENNAGVVDGITFLRNVNLGVKENTGESVAVIGGGNTAIDSARTAIRLGAKKVQVIYRRSQTEMPAGDDEVNAAIQEGVKITFLANPVKIAKLNGKLSLTCIRMELGEIDESGRRRPVPIKGSEYSASFDTIIAAIGQTVDIPAVFSLKTNEDNNLQADKKTLATNLNGVWAGGDAVTGPASVIGAIAGGRKAAISIDKYLGGKGIIDEKLTRARRIIALENEEFPVGTTRVTTPLLSPEKRAGNFQETELCLPQASADAESRRCLHCGEGMTSRCRYACPAGINVPLYVNLIRRGKYADALAIIREKVPFPGVLGRVCTSPCEAACTGCAMCAVYCPMNAIVTEGKVQKEVKIDQNECADCGVCFRAKVCPVNAIVDEVYAWPRSVRSAFSNPLVLHKETRVPGRGTEEVKTNEVTGQFKKGYIGVTAEMGRPGVGVRFRDVEKVAQALARAHVVFAANNPVTHMMTDKTTGKLNDEILNEKVCSAMIETTSPLENLPNVIKELREVATKINTVFSLTISSRLNEDGTSPCSKILDEMNIPLYPNGKTNLGLGRPLFKEES